MDYGKIFKRSIKITWKNKFLWIFGLLGSQGGGCNIPSGGGPSGDGADFEGFEQLGLGSFGDFWAQYGQLIGLIVFGLILLGLVFFILSIIFRGGLIHSVNQLNEDLPTGFGDGWRAGVRHFWRLLGLTMLFFLIIMALMIPFIVIAIAAAVSGEGAPAVLILTLIPLVLLLMLVIFASTIVLELSQRELIIADQRIVASLKAGWRLFTRNIGRSIVLWLIPLGSAIAFFTGLIFALLILAIPFVILGIAAGLAAGIIGGLLLLVPLLFLAAGFFGAYTSAIWTTGYRELKNLAAKSMELPQPPAPEAGPGPSPQSGPA